MSHKNNAIYLLSTRRFEAKLHWLGAFIRLRQNTLQLAAGMNGGAKLQSWDQLTNVTSGAGPLGFIRSGMI